MRKAHERTGDNHSPCHEPSRMMSRCTASGRWFGYRCLGWGVPGRAPGLPARWQVPAISDFAALEMRFLGSLKPDGWRSALLDDPSPSGRAHRNHNAQYYAAHELFRHAARNQTTPKETAMPPASIISDPKNLTRKSYYIARTTFNGPFPTDCRLPLSPGQEVAYVTAAGVITYPNREARGFAPHSPAQAAARGEYGPAVVPAPEPLPEYKVEYLLPDDGWAPAHSLGKFDTLGDAREYAVAAMPAHAMGFRVVKL